MSGPDLVKLLAGHGGITAVHVVPVRGGWVNKVVCADGFTRRLSKAEGRHLTKHQVPKIPGDA